MNTDRIEIYRGRKNLRRRAQWRWRYVASNGRRLANGGEGYANISELLSALEKVTGAEITDGTSFGNSRRATRANGSHISVVFI